jgi:hypothetical protein
MRTVGSGWINIEKVEKNQSIYQSGIINHCAPVAFFCACFCFCCPASGIVRFFLFFHFLDGKNSW